MDTFFKITERGSTVGREVRGGFVTFFTMAYIIVLNPIIIGDAADADGEARSARFAQIAAATALVAGVLTILMGVVANYPLALATGLGLNAFVAFSIASGMTWADAMGLVVIEGLIILVLVLTGFRKAVFQAVPAQLKMAISRRHRAVHHDHRPRRRGLRTPQRGHPQHSGAGRLRHRWVARRAGRSRCSASVGPAAGHRSTSARSPARSSSRSSPPPSSRSSSRRRAKVGPSFAGADVYNAEGWNLNVPAWPDKIVDTPDFELLGNFDLLGSFDRVGVVTTCLFIFTLLLADFFDTMGTMTAIGAEAGLLDEEGIPPNTQRILIVDSLAAAAGGAAAVSSNTSYIESASGVGEGARTGLASVVTGVLFLLATVFAPVVEIIPNEAAVPALVLVGVPDDAQVKNIDWDDIEIAMPAFLTIVLMPFTYSITVGIGAGFIAYVVHQGGPRQGRARSTG